MKTLTTDRLIGKTIEGVYQLLVSGPPNYQTNLVFVKLQNLGFVQLELSDPESPPALRLHIGDVGMPVTDSTVNLLIGKKVVDVFVSKYLASVSILCDDGSILTNDVLDFGNVAATITDDRKFISAGEYKSLK